MKTLVHPQTNVRTALVAILEDAVIPVVELNEDFYYLSAERLGMGTLEYTHFVNMVPVASYEVRFGSHHTVYQALFNPLPKTKLKDLVHTTLPEGIGIAKEIGSIIAGYLDQE